MKNYKELLIWKKSMELVTNIYKLTQKLPREEIYGLTSQMRRSAVSIPSNIAEGFTRKSQKEFLQFLFIAKGSASELETQILIANNVYLLEIEDTNSLLIETLKMLSSFIKAVREKIET